MWKPANLRNPPGLASPNHPPLARGALVRCLDFHPVTIPGTGGAVTIRRRLPCEIATGGTPAADTGRVREVTICRKLPCALSAATRRVSTGAVECGWMGCGKKSFHKVLQFPVEKFFFLHILLWINFPCLSKTKPSFPHKFPLLLLLLPKIFTFIFIIHYFTEMRSYHALYL